MGSSGPTWFTKTHRDAQRTRVPDRQLGHPLLLHGDIGLADQLRGAGRGRPRVRHQDQVGPLLMHEPMGSGELVVGADPGAGPSTGEAA
jgi:hypothetical protein